MSTHEKYFVPATSVWPIFTAIALLVFGLGFINTLHEVSYAPNILLLGIGMIFACMFGWFREVIHESMAGLYSKQMDVSFRMGMLWFIFSEVFFFGAFFGALFYVRLVVLNQLSGNWVSPLSHDILWPNFEYIWPQLTNPNPELFTGPKATIETWHLPALNTVLLLSSACTLTVAHWALKAGKRGLLHVFMFLTIALGIVFEYFQAYEYALAYNELGLTLDSGIYGSTFFMLTGFHAAHVIIGLTMLTIIWMRCMKGHFNKENHFAFEAAAWYWHFVDYVWLFLFVFVYWL